MVGDAPINAERRALLLVKLPLQVRADTWRQIIELHTFADARQLDFMGSIRERTIGRSHQVSA